MSGRSPDDTTLSPATPRAPEETTLVPPRTRPDEETAAVPPAPPIEDTTSLAGKTLPHTEETRDGSAPATDLAVTPPPTRVGAYELERPLGRGAVGAVWLARDARLDRRVALKLLRAGADATPAEVERFEREARAAARLSHKNVVAIHEVGQEGGLSFLAMELIDGPTLRDLIAKGPFDSREAARIAARLASALQHAHAHGILHRDVKPANALLDPAGEPRLTDFGLAKELGTEDGLTVTGEVLGTPAYMSPEQAAGEAALVDRRSDVWGLGATLYALLTGQPPFAGKTTLETLQALAKDDPPPPSRLRPGIEPDLDTIVLRCLEKEPARRYGSAGELGEDLERWLRHEPIRARPPTLADRAAKWLRRNRTVARAAGAVAAVAVLVIAAGGTWFTLRLRAALLEQQRQTELAAAQAREAEAQAARAREQEARADREAKQAEERSQIAWRSLTALVVEVHKQLEDLPGPRPLAVRQKLIGDALAELRRLRTSEPADAPLTVLAGEARRQYGDLLATAGRRPEAEVELRAALEVARKLVGDAAPGDDVPLGFLGVCLDSMGDHLQEGGDIPGARAAYEEALRVRAELAGRRPDLDARRNLAVSLKRVGDMQEVQGELPAAQATFERWLVACKELVAAAPDQPRLRLEEAFALESLANVQEVQGDLPGAVSRWGEAVAICRALVAKDEDDTIATETLAGALSQIGEAKRHLGDLPGAHAAHDEAIALRRRVREVDPSASADYALAKALSRAGTARRGAGELPAARRLAEESAVLWREALRRSPGSAIARRGAIVAELDLADLAREAKDPAAARAGYLVVVAALRELVAADPTNAQDAQNLAITLARLAELQAQEKELSAALASIAEAVPLLEARRARDPSNWEAAYLLSELHTLASKLHHSEEQDDAALASARSALAAAREVQRVVPEHSTAVGIATMRMDRVAQLLSARGERREALGLWLEAAEACRAHAAGPGKDDGVLVRNVSVYLRLAGLLHTALGELPAALEVHRAAHVHHARVVARWPQHAKELRHFAWDHTAAACRLLAVAGEAEAPALRQEALEALAGVVRGFRAEGATAADLDGLRAEPELEPLRGDPGFERVFE